MRPRKREDQENRREDQAQPERQVAERREPLAHRHRAPPLQVRARTRRRTSCQPHSTSSSAGTTSSQEHFRLPEGDLR